MPITKEQATETVCGKENEKGHKHIAGFCYKYNEFHKEGFGLKCQRIVGPRGGVKIKILRFSRNGVTKTWKTRPEDFHLPVKHGFYDTDFIGVYNGQPWDSYWHTSEDCPLNEEVDT